MLLLALVALGSFSASQATLAVTWDYCNCTFNPWQPWDTCTTQCFGQRVRERNASFSSNVGCDAFSDCATEDERFEWGSCNTVCKNGGTPTGKVASPCSCKAGYYGQCCDLEVDCGLPNNITHGHVTVASTKYNGSATYSCDATYNLTAGDTVRRCQNNFTWGGVEPKCVYSAHCSSSPCKNGATCVDLLDDYQCACAQGWSGRICDNDVMPPQVTGCSDNVYLNATSLTVAYSWNVPNFTDPMGHQINVTSNYPAPQNNFTWGDHTVTYIATKLSNSQQSKCTFTVIVRPTPCSDLNVPLNGARLCNGWRKDYGRYCMITCMHNYTLGPAYSFRTWRVCGASGKWLASSPLPDCLLPVHQVQDAVVYQPDFMTYSFNSSCQNVATQNALRKLYIDKLKAHKGFSTVCTKHPSSCVAENVEITC